MTQSEHAEEELADTAQEQEELAAIEVDLLLEGIYRASGYDFRNYLRSSLMRRISNRMSLDEIPTITSLLDRALHEPDYMKTVINDFSIKVTEMFRDPAFFYAFRKKVVPLLRHLPEIRIWSAGCATGEEVYSLGILLQEAGLLGKSKLYATDMSEQAIETAKQGKFPLKRMQLFTKNYLQAGSEKEFSAYYTADREFAHFHPFMKEHFVFAQHNLATDCSINEFHVILCRNVLIYFDSVLQQRVYRLLHDSLSPSGILALGSKETFLSQYKSKYEELAPEDRIFRKLEG
ncbi:CheR family methyltransferase [Paenibacillus harenae]|uniref:Chemotaxis protein methyltransferase CheR n=1 Tax=Paenibacillus harenae TaxID=306543 RepID=A0ABT9TXN5_PAEHA|nr:protein-glutamate O-methyltransferase CheR [Paenibacillus harenae]MDQ0112102.1 chemotaxis protein methyltransferase CheR [Paenibacillus harenae]